MPFSRAKTSSAARRSDSNCASTMLRRYLRSWSALPCKPVFCCVKRFSSATIRGCVPPFACSSSRSSGVVVVALVALVAAPLVALVAMVAPAASSASLAPCLGSAFPCAGGGGTSSGRRQGHFLSGQQEWGRLHRLRCSPA